jgi:hypothetical protein
LGFWLKRAQHAYRTRLDADLRPLDISTTSRITSGDELK